MSTDGLLPRALRALRRSWAFRRPPHAFVLTADRLVRVSLPREGRGGKPSSGVTVTSRDLPPGTFRDDTGHPVAGPGLAQAVASLLQPKERVTAASLAVPDGFVKAATVDVEPGAEKNPRELADVLRWKVGRLYGEPAPALRITWCPAGVAPDGGTRLLVLASPEETIASLEAAFSAHGIRIGALEPAALALSAIASSALGGTGFVVFTDGPNVSTVFLENGSSVHLEDMFSGNLDTAPVALSGLLTAVVFYLANNEFEEAGIHQIRLKAKALEEVKYASLERVWLDKYEAAPGERIQVRIYYRTYGGQSLQEAVEIDAPPLPAGSEFNLVIADAASMQQLEAGLYRSQEFVPRNFSQLVRLLNNLRKNNRIYFKMMASKPGLFLKGEEMPNLPPSIKSMFASPRASSAPTELTRSTLREYQLPIPFVFRGMAAVPVRIKD